MNPSNSRERWRRVCAVWTSSKTTLGFLLAFAAWLLLGTVTSMRRADDPKSTTGITLRLLHDVHTRLTFRGRGLFRSVAQLGDPDDLVGSGRLELERSSGEPCLLLLTLAIDGAVGHSFRIRDLSTDEEFAVSDTAGLLTHVGIPVTTRRAAFAIVPGADSVTYRFPRFRSVRILPPVGIPLQFDARVEFSKPVRLTGGAVRLGAGWDFRSGEKNEKVPSGPLRLRSDAWLELHPERPGLHRLRIPIRKVRPDEVDPLFFLSGAPVPARIEGGFANLSVALESGSRLNIRCPVASADLLAPAYEVDVSRVEIR